jgi:kynureninase
VKAGSRPGLERARELDEQDPSWRDLFAIPPWPGNGGRSLAYFAGNSLGLMPLAARQAVAEELDAWAALGVEGHFDGARPWLPYHELLRGPAARLVGAQPAETVAMNTLTVNLHVLMATFYRPTPDRYRIVIEESAFPSDAYAVASQAALHGLSPDDAILRLASREGEHVLRTEDVVDRLRRDGERVALVLLGAVNYLTGELMDVAAVTEAGHDAGATVGWDLAHAAGNVPLALHDWNVDFAAWCSYKYLNAGPGAVAGCFVHGRHCDDPSLTRLAGWWGHDPSTRFAMPRDFVPQAGAAGWQQSNPPILALAPVRVSLDLFDAVGLPALRARSIRLTGYLEGLLDEAVEAGIAGLLTPRDPERRGCQLSVAVGADATAVARQLRHEHGVIADVREPGVLRFAPTPLYSTYEDCWRGVDGLVKVLAAQ